MRVILCIRKCVHTLWMNNDFPSISCPRRQLKKINTALQPYQWYTFLFVIKMNYGSKFYASIDAPEAWCLNNINWPLGFKFDRKKNCKLKKNMLKNFAASRTSEASDVIFIPGFVMNRCRISHARALQEGWTGKGVSWIKLWCTWNSRSPLFFSCAQFQSCKLSTVLSIN